MPWRLIVFLVVFAVFLTFITFNLENRCDISFGFIVITQVPVFLTVFISFVLGVLCALPIALTAGKKHKKAPAETKQGTIDKIKQDAASARERFLKKRSDSSGSTGGGTNEIK